MNQINNPYNGMIRPEWLKFYDKAPDKMRVVQSWDAVIAVNERQEGAARLTIGDHKGKSYVIDSQVFRLEYHELKAKVYEMANKFNPSIILIEDRGAGAMLLQDLRRESPLPLAAVRSRIRDKIERFAALSCVIESGGVLIPKDGHHDLTSELLSIPYGRNDTQVDALSQYLEWLRNITTRFLRIRRI